MSFTQYLLLAAAGVAMFGTLWHFCYRGDSIQFLRDVLGAALVTLFLWALYITLA